MILVTNSQHGAIVFEGEDDEQAARLYCELKELPGPSHTNEVGAWVLFNGLELEVCYIDDYLEVKLND